MPTPAAGSISWDLQVPRPDVERITIKARNEQGDGYRFYQAAALLKFGDELFCSFTANKGAENRSGETALYTGSTADGRIWSTPREFPTPAAESYPHDIELKGKLYIAHLAGGKHNGNNIYLAIVGLVDVSF